MYSASRVPIVGIINSHGALNDIYEIITPDGHTEIESCYERRYPIGFVFITPSPLTIIGVEGVFASTYARKLKNLVSGFLAIR